MSNTFLCKKFGRDIQQFDQIYLGECFYNITEVYPRKDGDKFVTVKTNKGSIVIHDDQLFLVDGKDVVENIVREYIENYLTIWAQ